MNRQKIKKLTAAGMIAALYVVLTWLSALLGLDKGVVQCRLSEALCVLPAFFGSAAIPGLSIGCLLANVLTGCSLPDVLAGTVATLAGAVGTFLLRRSNRPGRRWLLPLPNIAANTLILPPVIRYAYGAENLLGVVYLTVGLGELIAAGGLGWLVAVTLAKHDGHLLR